MRNSSSNNGKSIIAIIIVLLILVCAGVGVLTFVKSGGNQPDDPAAKHVELTTWPLEEFVVNLADHNEPRYLKVNLVLEVEGKGKAKGGHNSSSGGSEEAKARDAIISVLTKKKYATLLSEEGKTKLKSDLKAELNKVLQDTKVESIYFTSFAMQ